MQRRKVLRRRTPSPPDCRHSVSRTSASKCRALCVKTTSSWSANAGAHVCSHRARARSRMNCWLMYSKQQTAILQQQGAVACTATHRSDLVTLPGGGSTIGRWPTSCSRTWTPCAPEAPRIRPQFSVCPRGSLDAGRFHRLGREV